MTESDIRADERRKIIDALLESFNHNEAKYCRPESKNLPPWCREVFGIEKIITKGTPFSIRS